MPSNLTYVRWRSGEPRRGRVFGAPASDHPTFGSDCLICDTVMTSTPIQLLAVGLTDGEDVDESAKAKRGEWFAAGAIIVHHRCAEELPDEDLEVFVASLLPMEVET